VEAINPDAAPSPRQWFSMTLYRRALYIFGGIDAKKNILNDFYRFDIGKWRVSFNLVQNIVFISQRIH
jgi:hypothetical protein